MICTDKTGTLTEGRMVTARLWADRATVAPDDPAGVSAPPFAALLHAAIRCSNAKLDRDSDGFRRTGDPSESALPAIGDSLATARISFRFTRPG